MPSTAIKSEFWIVLASAWHSSSDAEQDKDFLLILHRAWCQPRKRHITTRSDDLRVPLGKPDKIVPAWWVTFFVVLRRRFLVSSQSRERIDIVC